MNWVELVSSGRFITAVVMLAGAIYAHTTGLELPQEQLVEAIALIVGVVGGVLGGYVAKEKRV